MYSDAMLKHMPEKTLKKPQNTLLHSKKSEVLEDDNDGRKNNSTN